MKIESININHYKSLIDLKIVNPSPFTVFAGPNGSGKSNIFEALDFFYHFVRLTRGETMQLFGGPDNVVSKSAKTPAFTIRLHSTNISSEIIELSALNSNVMLDIQPYESAGANEFLSVVEEPEIAYSGRSPLEKHFRNAWGWKHFSRIFIHNMDVQRLPLQDDQRLATACGNLEKVLSRLLKDEDKRQDIVEWLQLLVPGFENIEIKSEPLSGADHLLVYEKGTSKPFSKNLISDGTFNIIALLTAVFQSDMPQFLCIEEPENGLHPYVIRELVGFFREQCKKRGHYIWLNTHSQTLVRELTTEEIIIVYKGEGKTKIKQIQGMDLYGLPMDEALLTNAIGGGNPW